MQRPTRYHLTVAHGSIRHLLLRSLLSKKRDEACTIGERKLELTWLDLSCLHFFDLIKKTMALDTIFISIFRCLFLRRIVTLDSKRTLHRIRGFKRTSKNASIGLGRIKAAAIKLTASIQVSSTVVHRWKEVDIHKWIETSIRSRWKRYITSL